MLYLQCNVERVQEVTTCRLFQSSIKNENILAAEEKQFIDSDVLTTTDRKIFLFNTLHNSYLRQ